MTVFFFSSRRRHTRYWRDWSSDVCSSDLFPYLNANVQQQMLLYRPRFRHPERASKPPNLAEAMSIAPGVTPANAEAGELMLDVLTPSGAVVAVDDPSLTEMLREGLRGEHRLTLVRSDRALTDCRPLSLISLQTVRQIGEELGGPVDKRRFRANVYVDLARSEEHTSELQSRQYLVCRLLLEKKIQ